MNSTRTPPGLGQESRGARQQGSIQRSRALARTYLLSSSVVPLTTASGQLIRLPALTKPAHHRSTLEPLSTPSVFTLGQRAMFEGFPQNRCPFLQKRSASLLLCKSCDDTERRVAASQPSYTHFTCPLRPAAKLSQPFLQSHTPSTGRVGLQPLVRQCQTVLQKKALAIRGRPCLPSQPSAGAVCASAPGPARTQLHVFLPSEGVGGEEDRDSESVDEGFMDELDNKFTSLRLQQGVPKIPLHPAVTASVQRISSSQ